MSWLASVLTTLISAFFGGFWSWWKEKEQKSYESIAEAGRGLLQAMKDAYALEKKLREEMKKRETELREEYKKNRNKDDVFGSDGWDKKDEEPKPEDKTS